MALELGELTAPALRPLDSQCTAADLYVSKDAQAKYDYDAGQAAMAEQDDGDLLLDDVNLREVSIILTSRFN